MKVRLILWSGPTPDALTPIGRNAMYAALCREPHEVEKRLVAYKRVWQAVDDLLKVAVEQAVECKALPCRGDVFSFDTNAVRLLGAVNLAASHVIDDVIPSWGEPGAADFRDAIVIGHPQRMWHMVPWTSLSSWGIPPREQIGDELRTVGEDRLEATVPGWQLEQLEIGDLVVLDFSAGELLVRKYQDDDKHIAVGKLVGTIAPADNDDAWVVQIERYFGPRP